jgi:HD-GYP domain-containing protein (c-di-GMP phosphodiesterase class II)
MRLLHLSSGLVIPDGATIGHDVMIPGVDGPPLLRRGVALNDRYVGALLAKGVHSVWIEDALSEGVMPERVLSPETQHKAIAAVGTALSDATGALTSGRGLSSRAVDDLEKVATMIAAEVHDTPEVALHLADMMGAEHYLLQHVVDVTALGTVLAARLFRLHGWVDHVGKRRRDAIDPRLSKIALGLLLHDIGKLAIPAETLNKPGELDQAEWAAVRRHPELGADMLGENVSFLVRAVVKQHHERWDGSGYPSGMAGEDIHQFARVAAVADVYDAVTSERVYRPAMTPAEGVTLIEQGNGTEFDPEVVAVFSRVVMPFPPGTEVELADGRTGLVVDVDPRLPYEPTVRVSRYDGSVEEIDRALLAIPAAV